MVDLHFKVNGDRIGHKDKYNIAIFLWHLTGMLLHKNF